MRINVQIDTDNDAFQQDMEREVTARMAEAGRMALRLLDYGPSTTKIIDSNGNTCGKVVVSE